MKNKKSVSTKKRKPEEKKCEDPNPRPKFTHNTKRTVWIENGILFEEVATRYYEYYGESNPETGERVIQRDLKEQKNVVSKFVLTPVEKGSLKALRKSGKPIFILKDGGKYFCTEIPFKLNLISANLDVEHKCVPDGAICGRFSASPDEMGGCAKLRDDVSHLEMYDFITKAYETNNTRWDAFVVAECLNQEVVPNIDPLEEARRRKQAAKKKKEVEKKKTIGNTEEGIVETLRKMPMLFY